MKRALLLVLLLPLLPTACERAKNDGFSTSPGTIRVAPADRPTGERRGAVPPSAAVSDPQLETLMTVFYKKVEEAREAEESGDPFATGMIENDHAEEIEHCREIASYYGRHYPEAGLAWLRTLDVGLAQVKARAFAGGLYQVDPEKAVRFYEQNVPAPLREGYLTGMATAAKGDLRLLWPLAETGPERQRESVAGTLIWAEAVWYPQKGWEHYHRWFPERGLAVYLGRLGPMAEGVPYPIGLLRQVPDTDVAVDHVMVRTLNVDIPPTALEFDAIGKWVETLPPSKTLGYLCHKMAVKQLNGPEPERAIEWVKRNPDPE